MIVDKMSYAQIAREIDRAQDRCDAWIEHNRRKIREKMQKSHDGTAVFYLPVGAKNPNLVLICKAANNKQFARNFFIWKETPTGKHFYSTSSCQYFKIYDEYTAHYMARYIERWHLDCTPMQAMCGIIINLLTYSFTTFETGNAPTEKMNIKAEGKILYKRTADGISVVDRVNNFFIHKTFLQMGMGLDEELPFINEVTLSFLQHMDDDHNSGSQHYLGYHEFDLHNPDMFEVKKRKKE